jgi:hypothetical protein
VGDRGRLRGRVVAEQQPDQLLPLAGRAAQHRVDEPRGVRGAGLLRQLDRLVDGGVVGRRVGEEQLIGAQAQRREDGRIELSQRPIDESFERGVDRSPALHGSEGEALGLGTVAAAQPALVGRPAKGALGVRLFPEGRPDGLVGELARRRDHNLGSGWPRR